MKKRLLLLFIASIFYVEIATARIIKRTLPQRKAVAQTLQEEGVKKALEVRQEQKAEEKEEREVKRAEAKEERKEKKEEIKEKIKSIPEQATLRLRFLKAVRDGDVKQVEELITDGANPNEREGLLKADDTVLAIVVKKNDGSSKWIEIARVLLNRGASPILETKGLTPLHIALDQAKTKVISHDMIALLLDKKYIADPDSYANYVNGISPITSETPIYTAAALVTKKINPVNILIIEPIIKALAVAGANMNKGKKLRKVDLKVRKRSDQQQLIGSNETPLYFAIFQNNGLFSPVIMTSLLKAGANPDKGITSLDGENIIETPLYKAIPIGMSVSGLINAGADINRKSYGEPPFITAVKSNNPSIIDLLLSVATLDIQAKDLQGKNALMYLACRSNRGDYVDTFIKRGINANDLDNEENNALHYVGNDIVLAKLLANQVKQDKQNLKGVTPLMYAVVRKLNDIVTALAKNGGPSLRDKDSKNTALIYAVQYLPTLNQALLENSDLLTQNSKGNTALMLAADKRDLSKVKALVAQAKIKFGDKTSDFSAFLNQENNDNYTALNYADRVIQVGETRNAVALYLDSVGALKTREKGGARAKIEDPVLAAPSC